MITRKEAREKIEKILLNESAIVKTGQKLPIRPGDVFNVYKIPIELLAPNVLNDRITWKIREYESENGRKLNIETDEDVQYIYDLILEDAKNDNERTKEDLAKKGQLVDGVITKDGIIIDGNRRATLLRLLFNGDADKYNKNVEDFRYFNAIVLPEEIDDKEIMALESIISIGSDKPVDYNRICLYIKVDNLLKAKYNYRQIKQYMGLKSEKDVEEMEQIYNLMVEYLDTIGKPNHYTLLDGLEDQFINTRKVFKRLDNESYEANWDYTKEDVSDFKMVCYEYMRAKFEGKKFRDIMVGKSKNTNGVFIEKTVWDEFLDNHNQTINGFNPLTEEDWRLLGKKGGQFEINLNKANEKLTTFKNDKNLSKLIKDIQIKVDNIKVLIDSMEEVSQDDIQNLRELSNSINMILNQF